MSGGIEIRAEFGRLTRFLKGSVRYDHIVLAGLALLIGIAVAYAATLFRLAITGFQIGAFGTKSAALAAWASDLPWWHVLLAPVVGGILLSLIYRFLTDNYRPKGVAEVIEANALRDGRMSIKDGIVSSIANAVGLGFGASTGREGPVIHLGASIASWIAQTLHLTPAVAKTLLACGVASAVAASFNAPIAGVFFALEVVMGHYAIHAFAPVVIAGVSGTIVSRIYLGDYPAFIIPDHSITSFMEMPAFAGVGLAAAMVAILFTSMIVRVDDFGTRLPLPRWALPPLAGLVVGLIALSVPEVLGVGYEATDKALHGEYLIGGLLIILAAKLVATSVSIGFGFGSGVFSPSLMLGAMTGGIVGVLAASAFPELASSLGVYAIVGMGAVASAVLGAPVSTVLIIFELTGDYSITIAVMIASAVAALATGLAHRSSFFYWMLERRGLHLEGGKALYLLKATTVREAMTRDFATVHRSDTISHVRDLLLAQYGGKLLVSDETGTLLGVVTSSEITSDAFNPELDHLIRAEDIYRKNPTLVGIGDSLEEALQLMDRTGEEHLPVVDNMHDRIIAGMLHHREVLRLYNRALVDAQSEMKDVKRKM